MPVSPKTFERVALEDPEGHWEFHCGELRRKPPMTNEHNETLNTLGVFLGRQLDLTVFRLRVNSGHVRRLRESYFIPDVYVVTAAQSRQLRGRPERLESFADPIPLVVEVWSRSTGRRDLNTKLNVYRQRGDHEIWLIHPYEKWLTAWRRQPDGSYTETVYRGGTIQPIALPGVTIDLDALFDLA